MAVALRRWLKQVMNAVEPWLSVSDIEKGTRWQEMVAVRLRSSQMGLICLTPENLNAEWLLFEAGALSKAMDVAYVFPLLLGLEPSDVSGPLAQFQATRCTKDDLRALVRTINAGLGESRRQDTELDEAFEVWWPKLQHSFESIPREDSNTHREPRRSDRELLDEVLDTVRLLSRTVGRGLIERNRRAEQTDDEWRWETCALLYELLAEVIRDEVVVRVQLQTPKLTSKGVARNSARVQPDVYVVDRDVLQRAEKSGGVTVRSTQLVIQLVTNLLGYELNNISSHLKSGATMVWVIERKTKIILVVDVNKTSPPQHERELPIPIEFLRDGATRPELDSLGKEYRLVWHSFPLDTSELA